MVPRVFGTQVSVYRVLKQVTSELLRAFVSIHRVFDPSHVASERLTFIAKFSVL